MLGLAELTPEAAIALLISWVGEKRIEEERQQAEHLCQELEYLPLGLELVGRYLQQKRDLSLAEMRQRLGLEHRLLQEPPEEMTTRLGVAAAFELSWQELDKAAQKLGCLLSLFALAPIPWYLVERCLPEWDAEVLGNLRDDRLIRLSLLERRGQGTYQLHQLIREFFKNKLEQMDSAEGNRQSFWQQLLVKFFKKPTRADQLKRRFCQAMVATAREIPEMPTQQDVATVAPRIPHLAEVATLQKYWLSDEDLIWPFVSLGRFYRGQGASEQAFSWYEQGLSVARERLGEEHPNVAVSLSNLAGLYFEQRRYGEAKPLLRQALELWQRLPGEESPDAVASLNNLAVIYSRQGQYAEAEPLLQQALALWKRLFGEEHPKVATCLNHLALLYSEQGRYAEAVSLHWQTLELRKRLLGEEHPDVATSLNNLALLYSEQGRHGEAEPLLRQALELWQRLMGEEHPKVATCLDNLAVLYSGQGRYGEAVLLYWQTLELRKRLLGEKHPDVAMSLNNLAEFYSERGRYSEAEPLLRQALEITEQQLGISHPDTRMLLKNWHFLLVALRKTSR
jgi:tetratricopeptide (TPR) repeat protein